MAVDISTNVVDQGLTEEEAIKNLKKRIGRTLSDSYGVSP